MPRKPTYDPEPLNRFRYNPDAIAEVTERFQEEAVRPLNDTIDAQASEMVREHGITEEVAALWLAHQVNHLLDEQRTLRASHAHHEGTPKTGIAEVLGWRGGAAATTRRMPTLDELVTRISEAQEEADHTGNAQTITLDSGYAETIHPRD